MDGKEGEEIVLKLPKRELKGTAKGYILDFALPNFWFHLTTAYNILRQNGVPVGKVDFVGDMSTFG